jgi:hypothetical protein
MDVMEVPVVYPLNVLFLRVNHNKNRGRAEMAINLAFNPFIRLNRETNLHELSPFSSI